MNLLYRFTLIPVIVLLVLSTLASQTIVDVKHLEIENGLKDRVVNKVVRDRYGYFYLVTQSGIQRYDGAVFEDVDISILDVDKIALSDISSAFTTQEGYIILTFIYGNQYVIYPKGMTLLSTSLPVGQLIKVVDDSMVLIYNEKKVFKTCDYTFSKGKGRLLFESEHLPDKIVKFKDFYLFETAEKNVYKIQNLPENFVAKGCLIKGKNGVFIFNNKGVFEVNSNGIKDVYTFQDTSYTCGIIKTDKIGNVIAAYSRRQRFYDRMVVMDTLNEVYNYDTILSVNRVFKDMVADDAFGQWMLAGYNGIYVVNLLRKGLLYVSHNAIRDKGEFGYVVRGVGVDKSNKIHYALELGGLFQFCTKDSTVVKDRIYESGGDDFKSNLGMKYHEKSGLHYLISYDYNGYGKIHEMQLDEQWYKTFLIPAEIIYDLEILDNNTLLITGRNTLHQGFLAKYDKLSGKLEFLRTDIETGRVIHYDEFTDRFLLGTEGGVHILDKQYCDIKILNKYQNKKASYLSQDHIRMIKPIEDKIFIGTLGGGLAIIDRDSSYIVRIISETEGLSNNQVIAMETDDEGNYWVATFVGLNVLDKDLKIKRKYYDFDGLPSREFNTGASVKDKDGKLYFGSLNGLAVIDPVQVLNWVDSKGIAIEKVVAYKNENQIVLSPTNISEYSTLDSIVISFAMPSYYKHYFDKYNAEVEVISDLDLSAAYGENLMTLGKLKPGMGTLKFNAPSGVYQDEISFSFSNDYRLLFKLLAFILVSGLLLYLFYRINVKRIKANAAEKTLQNKRIAELELLALRSQMNPHFIFNALGAIQYFIHNKNTERADSYLSDFAQLMRLILDSSKAKHITLQQEIKMLTLYVGLENMRFDEKFVWNVEVDEELDSEFRLPSMIIQPFVENSINHGLYNLSGNRGKLSISFEAVGEHELLCIVEDNGVGRQKAAELRMRKHKSRGLEIVNERVETINSTKDVNVNIQIIDLIEGAEPKGTRIEIRVKDMGQ